MSRRTTRVQILMAASVVVLAGLLSSCAFTDRITDYVGQSEGSSEVVDAATHRYWAQKVIEGGYILHFRHTQREKWNDVTAFDAIELLNEEDARTETYARATCLTEQGIEEAKLINRVFDELDVPVTEVISSPSCRARETAQYAFDGWDSISNSLLHRTAMSEEQWPTFARQLRELITGLNVAPNGNVVLSGHGGTLSKDGAAVVDVDETTDIDEREEGGFVVLEIVDGEIIARHKFASFFEFANNALLLPTD